jgi:hypothetical protein
MSSSDKLAWLVIAIGVIGFLWMQFPTLIKSIAAKIKNTLSTANWNFIPFALLIVGGVWLLRGGDVGTGCSLPNIPIVNKVYPDAWVVIIEESSERTKEAALILQDWTWRQSLEERGINFRTYDDDQKEAEGYKKLNLSLPAIVFILPDGQVVKTAKLPKDKKGVENLILEVTGK